MLTVEYAVSEAEKKLEQIIKITIAILIAIVPTGHNNKISLAPIRSKYLRGLK
jgi:hypothetical protein